MIEKIGGSKRYAMTNAPPVANITAGSADDMVSTVDVAMGLASSITFVVC